MPDESRPLRGRGHVQILRVIWSAILLCVITGTLMPGNFAPMQALGRLHLSDKLEHFSAYFVLAVIPALTERTPVRIAIAIGLVGMGVMLEYLQLFTGRDFDPYDMLANACGVSLGMLIGFGWLAIRRGAESGDN